jgi:hypothetical protein
MGLTALGLTPIYYLLPEELQNWLAQMGPNG